MLKLQGNNFLKITNFGYIKKLSQKNVKFIVG